MEPKFETDDFPFTPRAKRPKGSQLGLRQLPGVEKKDVEQEPMKFVALALVHLRNQLAKITRIVIDQSKRVDEYQVQVLTAEINNNSLSVMPIFEVGEIIESIVVTGPAAGTFTLQLGDRTWNLVMPATQFLMLGAPLGLMLGRNDPRTLTSATAGEWTLELMGHADTRGNII